MRALLPSSRSLFPYLVDALKGDDDGGVVRTGGEEFSQLVFLLFFFFSDFALCGGRTAEIGDLLLCAVVPSCCCVFLFYDNFWRQWTNKRSLRHSQISHIASQQLSVFADEIGNHVSSTTHFSFFFVALCATRVEGAWDHRVSISIYTQFGGKWKWNQFDCTDSFWDIAIMRSAVYTQNENNVERRMCNERIFFLKLLRFSLTCKHTCRRTRREGGKESKQQSSV